MTETDNQLMRSKSLISFQQGFNTFYNSDIPEYIYPICVFKNPKKKEIEEMKNIQNRMLISSKRNKEVRRYPTRPVQKIPKNKDSQEQTSLQFIVSNEQENTTQPKLGDMNPILKQLIRSKSQPIYPYCNQEIFFHKKNYLFEIEKRGHYYNKMLISSLQRQFMNNTFLKKKEQKKINFFLNNSEEFNWLKFEKNFSDYKNFNYNRIVAINTRRKNFNNIFRAKKVSFPHIIKDNINIQKRKVPKRKRQNMQISNSPKIISKSFKIKDIKDIRILASIKKINDQEILQKYKNMIYK